MKLPLIIFICSALALFVNDFFLLVLPKVEIHQQGVTHPEVQAFVNSIDHVIDATEGPVVEKRYTVGILNRVTVNPGFRIIHDPKMGREVIVSGPEVALEHLVMSKKTGYMVPDFNRPVRLKKLVEVRLNLHSHGSREMRIATRRVPAERTTLQPDFVTAGPLNFQMLRLGNFPNHPLQVASKDLSVYTTQDLHNLHGTVERLEILYDAPGDEKNLATAPNLKFNQLLRTKMGRD